MLRQNSETNDDVTMILQFYTAHIQDRESTA